MVDGWSRKKLGDIAEIRMCKRVFADQTTLIGEIPFYKIGTFGKEPDAFITRELYDDYRSTYPFPSKGDILLSAAGTLGRTVVFDGKPAYFQDSNIVWLDIDHNQVSNEYLFQCYKTIKWASPEGSTISRLYNGIIRETELFLPPLLEQHAIAEVLSDMDGYISELKKLIEKKQNIKKGVMQDLLTGKHRLAGCSESWTDHLLENIKRGELITSSKIVTGNIPVIAGGKTPAYYHNKSNYVGPCITVSASGANAGYVWHHKEPIFASDCLVILPDMGYDLNFLYQLLVLKQNDIFKLQTGGAQPHVYPAQLKKIKLSMPPVSEQIAIAEILMDMDKEINLLIAKTNKLQLIKQGMMQELLTGRIRLISDIETNCATISDCNL